MFQRTTSQRTTSQRSLKILAICFCLALLATAGQARTEQLTEVFSQTYPLSADGRIGLESLNGDVTIEGWDRDEVQLDYVKKAKTQEGLDRVEVMIDTSSSSLEISTEYKRSNERRGWQDGGSVDFKLYVPHGARLDSIELVNGDLEVRQIAGEVSIDLVNGDVNASGLTGRIEVSSVNGDMNIALDELTANQRVELEAVNGSLTVMVPGHADAQFEAETVHGSIDSDFGFEVKKDKYVGRSLRGTMGNGSAKVELENVNGSIHVRSQ